MKTLLLSFLLAVLPIVNQTNSVVSIGGNIDLRPGETTVLGVSPENPSYTYEWDFGIEPEKVERQYSYSISGNRISITHLNVTQYGLLDVYCTVYDENGNNIGSDMVEIIVQPYW